ncbi:hypothetical protein [Moritella viscosa]|uniref:Uncharacterized protein n=1 Tax=Moritella viscosa TaxID=80854 RepID=A0A1K9ZC97_9GAMM|nr:hypothetical protein [Moritella viscosa]SGY94810.1 Putative uncharacterized protein [Moritella viscosa]
MFIYYFACFGLVAVGYLLGANGAWDFLFLNILNSSFVSGLVASVIVSIYFLKRDSYKNKKILRPKVDKLLLTFRFYYTTYMLVPDLKPDIVGAYGVCEDAFNFYSDVNFKKLYERSSSTSLSHLPYYSRTETKIIEGLESHKHLETFLYVTNVEIKKLINEIKLFSYCLDDEEARILEELENSLYIMAYDQYRASDSGTWTQMKGLYQDINEYGEGAILPPKYIAGVPHRPTYLRELIFNQLDSNFDYFFNKMKKLQMIYDRKYKKLDSWKFYQ